LSSDGLFTGLFVPEGINELTSDRAWLQAMLDVEAALAAAEAEAGVIPQGAASAIARVCSDADRFDLGSLGREARASGNPVVPLVAALAAELSDETAGFVHWGATSQDVMDSAAMLVAHRALPTIDSELWGVASVCAALADEHRATPMPARTLLQQALPTSFGLKAAGWLAAVGAARERLDAIEPAAQLGGAAGTLAALGSSGADVPALFAAKLELAEPELPWHTARGRVAELGAGLALAAGAVEKIALDLVLMSQTEVGEVAESSAGGRGGSSTLPQKRNPVGSVLAIACARRVRGAAGVLLEAMPQEHERAAGAWQSEWEALREALALSGGAAASVREALEGLEIRPERMRQNLEAGGGLLMSESVTMALAEHVGRVKAKQIVGAVAARALDKPKGRSFREELLDDKVVSAELSAAEIDAALDPAGYLGSSGVFIDRALASYREDGGA
jgi:3-carboxy-cis,cis-muconate cycloisomerase